MTLLLWLLLLKFSQSPWAKWNRTKIGGIHQHTGNSQDHSSHQQEGSLFMSERKDFCSIAIHNYVSALSSSPSPQLIYLGIHNTDIYADLCSLKLFSRSLIQFSRVPWGETFCGSLQWQRLIEAPASLRVAFLSKSSSEIFKKKKHWTEKKREGCMENNLCFSARERKISWRFSCVVIPGIWGGTEENHKFYFEK